MHFTSANFVIAYPEIFLLAAVSIILLVDLFLDEHSRWVTYALSQLTVLVCALLTVATFNAHDQEAAYAFSQMFVADRMAVVLKLFTYIAVATCFVYSRNYLGARNM